MNFKITFHLDGTGIYYDPAEPIHLDSLLAWALVPFQSEREGLERGDTPDDIQLPLLRSSIHGYRVWHASALFPVLQGGETLRFWRKKFRQNCIELTSGSPNLTSGIYREYNMPVPLLLVPRMIAYASGNCKSTKQILRRHVKSLGKKRAYGYGKIVSIESEEIPEDLSLIAEGVAMRWLPSPGGSRQVRPSPPYWNNCGKVTCCEVGDMVELSDKAPI